MSDSVGRRGRKREKVQKTESAPKEYSESFAISEEAASKPNVEHEPHHMKVVVGSSIKMKRNPLKIVKKKSIPEQKMLFVDEYSTSKPVVNLKAFMSDSFEQKGEKMEKVENQEISPKVEEEVFMLLDGPESKIVSTEDIPEDINVETEIVPEEMQIILDEKIDIHGIPQEKVLNLVSQVMKDENVKPSDDTAVFIEQEESVDPGKIILKAFIC